ncbi:MAG: hypothetical protein LBI49_05480 [Nocardiopsaceae bacterium]|jgi:hypothetical protein|nr:hypothetical protein [Nocardiopsaceae bacterium]
MTQVTAAPARTRAQIAERTLRKDPWWRVPAVTATLLTIWVAYATVRVFMGHWYYVPQYHYLTPFYSPCINGECVPGSASLGTWLPALPPIIPYALVSLPFILGFRLSCYYYRRAYYRSFWQAPTACAVREPHATYSGETRFPLIMQNLHRYFFWITVAVSVLNTYDLIQAFHGKTGGVGLGLGTLIMLVNVVLLWGYTLGCHSCRHITGGRLKNFSKHPVRYWAWTRVSWLNARHMQFAWTTLGTLMLTDLYIALLAAGVFSDPRIFN